MAKTADKYFVAAPWEVIEDGFDSNYARVAESIFSLGNEYMGIRGFFEEGYTGDSLIGSYFNGVYETQKITGSAYQGMIDHTEFMVNSLNWLYTRIIIDGEVLDLNKSHFKNYKRILNLKTGVLTRRFEWITKERKEIILEFERFLSMSQATMAGQRIKITAKNFCGEISIHSGLDFSLEHYMVGENLWNCTEHDSKENYLSITGTTKHTMQVINSVCRFQLNYPHQESYEKSEQKVIKKFKINLEKDRVFELKKIICNTVIEGAFHDASTEFNVKSYNGFEESKDWNYDTLMKNNTAWWEDIWKESDISIEGDEFNQQGIRFCIFQMHQTYHGAKLGTNIGAKGLTGEAYSGNAFWDTETYCLPFYIFNNVKAAKNLLMFRYITLDEAKKRAKALDCEGAFYPIATISGRECCSLWQHASLQLQASTGVAYGIWIYEKITKDISFVEEYGLPMLIEISRMLATRGDFSADGRRYGYYGVMGPDEFQMMVNHNCYTNYMGKITLNYTLDVLNRLGERNQRLYQELKDKYSLKDDEIKRWSQIAEAMYIPYDESAQLFEQHEGYFKLPHIDIDKITNEEFPLYHHWTYDRIYRNDMIKQPDVLMLMLLFNSQFTKEQIQRNYEFYEPRCIHESSLSPSVHSILASQLQKHQEAYDFFGFATRMDLDNYNRNTNEGLHTTSIAAAWMNIVFGFGGMRVDGEVLNFTPSIPKRWEGYSFRISYEGDIILVSVSKEEVSFEVVHGSNILVKVYGENYLLGNEKIVICIPEEWRG